MIPPSAPAAASLDAPRANVFSDTHAHLFAEVLRQDLAGVLARAKAAGVERILCVGTDLESSRESVAIAESNPNIFASVGVHPHDARAAPADYLLQLNNLAKHPKVVALGEMGLDYFRQHSPREMQERVFREQVALAAELDLPVVIHQREAAMELVAALSECPGVRGVAHCFTGTAELARTLLALGLNISFTGTITFGKRRPEEAIRAVPMERMMLETDCPYLAPVPKRGTLNEPANIPHIAHCVAEVLGSSGEEVGAATSAAAAALFGWPA